MLGASRWQRNVQRTAAARSVRSGANAISSTVNDPTPVLQPRDSALIAIPASDGVALVSELSVYVAPAGSF
jgi:hypothetical protein